MKDYRNTIPTTEKSNEKREVIMKDLFANKIENITMNEFIQAKTVIEHDTDFLFNEVDMNLKLFMKGILDNSNTHCTYHFYKYVVDTLDEINNFLKITSYELMKGSEALEAVSKITDEENADVVYFNMYLSLASHKFHAYATVWESYLHLKEEAEEYLKNNEEPTNHTH